MPRKNKPKLIRHLSPRERAMLKNLSQGMTATDAAIEAGYSPRNPRQSGYQALQGLKKKVPELMEKHDLCDDTLIYKYLIPALEARETRVVHIRGKVTDSREVISWPSRVKALDLAFKIRGLYANRRKPEPERNYIKTLLV
jgi:hypothetical protein